MDAHYTVDHAALAHKQLAAFILNAQAKFEGGNDFCKAYAQALDTLISIPLAARDRKNGLRIVYMKRFHYGIVYTVNEAQRRVLITDIFAPGMDWQARLNKLK